MELPLSGAINQRNIETTKKDESQEIKANPYLPATSKEINQDIKNISTRLDLPLLKNTSLELFKANEDTNFNSYSTTL